MIPRSLFQKLRLSTGIVVVAVAVVVVVAACLTIITFELQLSSTSSAFLQRNAHVLGNNTSTIDDSKEFDNPMWRSLSEFRQRYPPKNHHPLRVDNNVIPPAVQVQLPLNNPRAHHGQSRQVHSVPVQSQPSNHPTVPLRFTRRDFRVPPLRSIVDDNNTVIGDPQPLLHYAIIGFGKCGTSTMQKWLAQHPQVQSLEAEICALMDAQPWRLIRRLHRKIRQQPPPPDDKRIIIMRGYKCPREIHHAHAIQYYRKYWPQTKLFVGIRHPIHWFQSLYNFRIQNFQHNEVLPHANWLLGTCHNYSQFVCTEYGDFAYALLKLGKQHWNGTRPSTPLEKEITGSRRFRSKRLDPETEISFTPNEVFLFDVSQFSDSDQTRRDAWAQTVQHFLGLDGPPLKLDGLTHVTPGMEWSAEVQAQKDARKINICERQYIPLRRELMYLSRINALWIREVFLTLPGVYVANREHFESVILESYRNDPCGPESEQASQEESEAILNETRTLWPIPMEAWQSEDTRWQRLVAVLGEQSKTPGGTV